MHPLLGRLAVNFVLLLISFIAYSSQIFIIWPWYGNALSVELLTLLLPFNFLVGMLLWNYYLCVVTDPGRVPDSWRPDTHEDGVEVKKLTGEPRHCRTCQKYKPPRAHHCKQCDRCVLRMDHHCPWVNNCVGYYNYGHFLRFLFYVDLACSYHLAMVTRRVFYSMGQRYWDEPTSVELVFIIMNYVACVPVLLCVGGFSLYHFYSLLGNTTTIEGWEKDKVATMVRRGKIQEVKFPYNLGKRRNIESVLGKDPLWWCWPQAMHGTGLKYQLGDGAGVNTWTVVWPPRDPTIPEYENGQEFTLPSSPWTYENGSLNPNLEPFNTHLRSTSSSNRRISQNGRKNGHVVSSVPPYHPDYEHKAEMSLPHSLDSDSDNYADDDKPLSGRPIVRRGSEGYEVRPADREEMLRRYIESQAQEIGRYRTYVPEPGSESDSDVELK